MGGVAKGAFSESDAEAKFNKWMSEKEAQINAKTSKLAADASKVAKARFEAEQKVKEERAKAIAAKKEAAAAEAAAEESADEATEETTEAAE